MRDNKNKILGSAILVSDIGMVKSLPQNVDWDLPLLKNEWEKFSRAPGVEWTEPSVENNGMGIYHQLEDWASREPNLWSRVTQEDLDELGKSRMLLLKSRRIGLEETLRKIILKNSIAESPQFVFPPKKRNSNYTKPKNRGKKK